MADETGQAGGRPNFPKMEEEMAAYWEKKNIFERSVEERPEGKTFVFYDGPPFATGTPHYGHILQSVIKDVIPRAAALGLGLPWAAGRDPGRKGIEPRHQARGRGVRDRGIHERVPPVRLSVRQGMESVHRAPRAMGGYGACVPDGR